MDIIKVQQKLVYILFLIMKAVVHFCSSTFKKLRIVKHDSNNIQRHKILTRHKPYTYRYASKKDFITWPRGTKNLDWLQRDDVTLYSVSETFIYFVETNEVIVNGTKYVDIAKAQFDLATHLLIVPHKIARTFIQKLEFFSSPLLLIPSQKRSGLIEITQLFSQIPNLICIAQCDAFSQLAEMSRQSSMSHGDLLDLLMTCLKLATKGTKEDTKVTVLTLKPQVTYILELFLQLSLPSLRVLYLYRDPLQWTFSHEKTCLQQRYHSNHECVYQKRSYRWLKMWAGLSKSDTNTGNMYTDVYFDALTHFSRIALIWVRSNAVYLDLVEKRMNKMSVKALRYDDILTRPKVVLQAIMRYVKLEEFGPIKIKFEDFQENGKITSRRRRTKR